MMARVKLSHPWRGNGVGDVVDVEDGVARGLVRAGTGLYAAKTDAADDAHGLEDRTVRNAARPAPDTAKRAPRTRKRSTKSR